MRCSAAKSGCTESISVERMPRRPELYEHVSPMVVIVTSQSDLSRSKSPTSYPYSEDVDSRRCPCSSR